MWWRRSSWRIEWGWWPPLAGLLSDILRVWFLQQMVEHGDGLWCIARAVWQALVFCLEARYHTFSITYGGGLLHICLDYLQG